MFPMILSFDRGQIRTEDIKYSAMHIRTNQRYSSDPNSLFILQNHFLKH